MKTKLILPVIILLMLTSCARVVTSVSDEVRMNSWSTKLKNGSGVSLSFCDDKAEFKIVSDDKNARARLKGLCFIDDSRILIYNQSEREPYIFKYKIKNNKLILSYNKGSLTLTR